jgi:hypothetical protein
VPRALAIRYLTVVEAERARYLARLAERTASARACGHHLWAFAHGQDAARYVEFLEAGDPAALRTALTQDQLLAEGLDFRAAPTADESAAWELFVGLPGAS